MRTDDRADRAVAGFMTKAWSAYMARRIGATEKEPPDANQIELPIESRNRGLSRMALRMALLRCGVNGDRCNHQIIGDVIWRFPLSAQPTALPGGSN